MEDVKAFSEISRFTSPPVDITCTSDPATTAKIAFSKYAGGVLTVASTGGVTQIDWYAAARPGDTPLRVYSSGSAVTTALTVGVHPFPDATYACALICPVVVGAASMPAVITVKG
jgi:hypothetical protein